MPLAEFSIHFAHRKSRARNDWPYHVVAYDVPPGTSNPLSSVRGFGDTLEEAVGQALEKLRFNFRADGVDFPSIIVDHGKESKINLETLLFGPFAESKRL